MVKFTTSNSASNVTLNVNSTGAYPIWYSNAEYTGSGTAYTGYANRTITYMFNGTHWVWVSGSYDANTQSNTNSTDTSDKIFLVGATTQGSSKTTYSHGEVYVGTDHHVYSNSKQVVNLSDTQALTNKTYNGYTLGAACAKGVDTSIAAASSSTNVPTSKAVAAFVEGKGYKTTDNNTTYSLSAPASKTNGNASLKLDASSGTDTSVTIKGSGATTVTSDSSGNLVISSTDTNTTYEVATASAPGLMSPSMVEKLNGIADGANNYAHPAYAAKTGVPTANQTPAFGGTFSVSQPVSDTTGHITAINSRTVTIPATEASTNGAGLMSKAMFDKLNGIATGANNYTLPTASGSTLGGVKSNSTTTTNFSICPIKNGYVYYKTLYVGDDATITTATINADTLGGYTAAEIIAQSGGSSSGGGGTIDFSTNHITGGSTVTLKQASNAAGLYPRTLTSAVLNSDGTTLEERLTNIENNSGSGSGGTVAGNAMTYEVKSTAPTGVIGKVWLKPTGSNNRHIIHIWNGYNWEAMNSWQ